MTIIVPQQNITQTLTLNQSQLLSLLSGFTIAPAVSSYINVFQKATISYRFGTTVFTNTNNVLSFKLGSAVVSNSLNATNILGLSQSTSISFSPANPYSGSMASSANTALTFNIDTANILGGDATSSLSITFTYSVFAA